jgi:hypothetical protein
MDKFTVKTRKEGESCFISVEGTPLRIELNEPADFQHAWRVANYLIENVRDVVAGSAEPEMVQPTVRAPAIN